MHPGDVSRVVSAFRAIKTKRNTPLVDVVDGVRPSWCPTRAPHALQLRADHLRAKAEVNPRLWLQRQSAMSCDVAFGGVVVWATMVAF